MKRPGKEDFKYLLFCAIAQNGEIGVDIMTALLKSVTTVNEYNFFILEIVWECQNPEIDNMVKSKLEKGAYGDAFYLRTFESSGYTTNALMAYIHLSGLEKVVSRQT